MQIDDKVYIAAREAGLMRYQPTSDGRAAERLNGRPLLAPLLGIMVEWRSYGEGPDKSYESKYEHPSDWLDEYSLAPFASDKAGGTWGFFPTGFVGIFDTGELAVVKYGRTFSEFLYVALVLGVSAVPCSTEAEGVTVAGNALSVARAYLGEYEQLAEELIRDTRPELVEDPDLGSFLVSYGRTSALASKLTEQLGWDDFLGLHDPRSGKYLGKADVGDVGPY